MTENKEGITLIIEGRPISKKNSRRWIWRGGKQFSVPSAAYEKYKGSAIKQIDKQKKIQFDEAVEVHCDFYIQGKYKVDGDNLLSSIFDILEDAGIIEDDGMILKGSFTKYPGSGGWGTKIKIMELRGKNAG